VQENNQLRTGIRAINTDFDILQNQNEAMCIKSGKWKGNFKALAIKFKQLQEQHKKISKKNTVLEQENRAQATYIEKLKVNLDKMATENKKLKRPYEEEIRNDNELNGDLQGLRSQLEELESENHRLKQTLLVIHNISALEPERPPPPKKPVVKRRRQPEPRPEPQYVPEEYVAHSRPQPPPVTYQQEQPVAQNRAAPIAPENVFGLFNQPEVKKVKAKKLKIGKVEEPVTPFFMNPSMPANVAESAPAPVQEETTTKLNNILKQIQMREEEEKRKKEEKTKRMEAIQAIQAQFATKHAMNPMMNSIMNPMMYMNSPMFRGNPYMTGNPGMQRPQAPGAMPYQVNFLYNA